MASALSRIRCKERRTRATKATQKAWSASTSFPRMIGFVVCCLYFYSYHIYKYIYILLLFYYWVFVVISFSRLNCCATGSLDKTVQLFDLSTASQRTRFKFDVRFGLSVFAFGLSSSYFAFSFLFSTPSHVPGRRGAYQDARVAAAHLLRRHAGRMHLPLRLQDCFSRQEDSRTRGCHSGHGCMKSFFLFCSGHGMTLISCAYT
jgi:hypothetical protein